MYTLEFFNRCNITQPDRQSTQEFRQICKQNLFEKKAKCLVVQAVPKDGEGEFVGRTFPTKKLCFRMNLHAGKGLSSRLSGSAAGAAGTILAGDYPLQVGKNHNKIAENGSLDSTSEMYFGQATEREELAAMRESAMRSKLMRKLSEANNYGRHLRRQLHTNEAALLNCKSELTRMEVELQALVGLLIQEAAMEGAKPGSRKVNGKYVNSHVALKLQELQKCLLFQVKEIDTVCFRDVPLVWYGMAEAVQVMGSFDGWSQGEQMSPESSSSLTKFSAVLKLRPGRYEIKLLVDGEWLVSPKWPIVGEGLTANNLLVVE